MECEQPMTMTLDRPLVRKHTVNLAASDRPEVQNDALVISRFFRAKESVDRIIACILLIPALPLIALLVVLVRLNSPGPGIFCQTRVGKNGRIFTMFKIRTMHSDAEKGTGPVWASLSGDPRVTRLGYWLRRLHLDELPQLFNVVCGQMSLVGPRPERPAFVDVLSEQVPGYIARILVKPGVTGLAQVNLPPDTDLDSVRRKLALDREYIATANLGLDLRIVGCTILRVFGLRGGLSVRMLGIARPTEAFADVPLNVGLPAVLVTPDGVA